tara:strand:- start:96 stop:1583 length:1488 start_codon:yes stop_codon:yes gene_type:complete
MSVNEILKNKLSIDRRSKVVAESKTEVSRSNAPKINLSKEEKLQQELNEIRQKAEALKVLEEGERILEEKRKYEEKINSVGNKLNKPFSLGQEIDFSPVQEELVERFLPKTYITEQKIEYPEPFQEEPALNRELAEFKRKINQHLNQLGFASSSGGGEVRLEFLDDVERSTAKVNGKFLKFDSSSGKFVGDDASVSNETIQDIVGAMFSSNTETGITVSYQDADGTIDLVVGTLNQDTTGNAATATALETARNIGGVSFDGTGNINLPGVNTSGSQDTSGNAATATALATARNIAGVSFDGTADISLALTNLGISDGSNGQFLKTDGAGNFSFATASVSSLAADDIDAGDAAVNITTSSGNITIDAAANNTDIIFKGTDASADITMLTLDGSEAGAATFNDKIVIQSSHLNQGVTQDSANLFIVLDGTDAASANAGDNIIIEDGGTDGSGTNAGDDILHEDFAYTHTGVQREVLEIRDSGGGLLKSLSGFAAGAI